ncbi:MAG: DUF2017 family protein [Microbacterium sp.]|uniref:DUF2017 family protein n=1 Tax=Microbacterium sp. TaxID=51671 RepID=UPI0039E491E6
MGDRAPGAAMTADVVLLTITRVEARHLADLVAQFADLLRATPDAQDDPAVARLVPDAYPEDASAAREFRDATEADLLDRRREDAHRVVAALATAVGAGNDHDVVDLPLSMADARAWMRALAALRLVLASRLGIRSEDDHDPDDPRFGVYDWIGYRLDGLVRAVAGDP